MPGIEFLLIVVLGVVFYFMMIRPQQKRMREHQEMISQLEPGARVVLTSGIFATILHAGEKQMIVEIAPGVEITILKGHVSRVALPADEEFEYEDEAALADEQPADESVTVDEVPSDGGAQGASDEEPQAIAEALDAEGSTDNSRTER